MSNKELAKEAAGEILQIPVLNQYMIPDMTEIILDAITKARKASAEELLGRIQSYLGNGGLFNPEMMEHEKVRELLIDCRDCLTKANEQGEDTKRMDWLETQGKDEGGPFVERQWEIRGPICLNVRAAIDSAMNKKD